MTSMPLDPRDNTLHGLVCVGQIPNEGYWYWKLVRRKFVSYTKNEAAAYFVITAPSHLGHKCPTHLGHKCPTH